MAAPKDVDLIFRGLATDPNPYAVPDGSLMVADNVVIERGGLVQPRPGLDAVTSAGITAVSDSPAVALLPLEGSYFAVLRASGPVWSLRQEDGTEVTDEAAASVEFDDAQRIQSALAGGALLVTTKSGIRRLDSTTATTAYRLGVPRMIVPALALNADAPAWLATGDAVAYRLVLARRVGDRTYRGAPSGLYGIDNGAGAGRSVDLTVYLPPDAAAADVLEVYRTTSVTGTWDEAGDEMQLAHSVTLAAADITAGSVTVEDRRDDADLGAFLYTNATQQSLAQSNFRPPKADAVAHYNNMMVYGGTEQPGRVLVQMAGTPASAVGAGPIKDTATIDTTLGSPIITTSLSPNAGWVGMILTDRAAGPGTDGTNIPADSVVLAVDVGAKTVTISNAALASNTGVSAFVVDFVAIESTNYYAWDSEDAAERLWDASLAVREATASICRTINEDTSSHVAHYLASDDNPGALLIEAANLNQASYTVSTSRETGWDLAPGDGVADPEDRPGRIYLSKPGEYESVPPVNFVDVGNAEEPIMGLAQARQSLLVFKADGVFALTGDTPESVRVDGVDSTLRLLHRHCVDAMDDRAYAWTNRGVVAVTAAGVSELTTHTIQSDVSALQRFLITTEGANTGPFLVCDPNQRRVYFGVALSAKAGADHVYVFHADTSAWTKWDKPATVSAFYNAAYWPAHADLVVCGQDSGSEPVILQERDTGNTYDRTFDVTITDASDLSGFLGAGFWSITISAGSGWTPAIGDAIGDGSALGIVTAFTSATELTIQTEDTFATGAATAYEAYTSTVSPVVKTAKDPFLDKHWLHTILAFVLVDNLRTVTLAYTSNVSGTADELEHTVTSFALARWFVNEDRHTLRASVPTDHARGAVLLPKITIKQATSRWAIAGLAASFEPMSDRVHA